MKTLTNRQTYVTRSRSDIVCPDSVIELRNKSLELLDSLKIEQDKLLSIIFAVDEFTRLPKGDLALYLGENCNPSVREYIEKNLLQSVQSENLQTSDLDDDTILQLTRGIDESRRDYVSRINNYMEQLIYDEKTRLRYETNHRKD